ncbi:MAG TPA: hypothetical protein VE999_10020 [Gemmataceae bacterium]|nr:hypothetical protein [Gemmataceae bacterium]
MVHRKFGLALGVLWLISAGALGVAPALCDIRQGQGPLHFAPNGNFDPDNKYLPAMAGFNLADVSSREELDALPEGVKGLVWVGSCDGVDASFKQVVLSVISDTKLFGFYLVDDPDPRGLSNSRCRAENLKAESDWIHEHRSDVVTFVSLMDLGESTAPSFGKFYTPETTHADLFGVEPYPCRTEWATCNFDIIDRAVHAAVESGIPLSKLVPIYQAFGSGEWRTDTGGRYRIPSPEELREILRRWSKLVPSPVFDYAYSWGTQRGDEAIASSPDLQGEFLKHNAGRRNG